MLQLRKLLLGGTASVLQGSCYFSRLIELLRSRLIDQRMVRVDVLRWRWEALSLTLMCLELMQLVIKDSLLVWNSGLLTGISETWQLG